MPFGMSIHEIKCALGSVVDGGVIYPGRILEIRRGSEVIMNPPRFSEKGGLQ